MNTKHTPGPWLVRFTLDKWCASYQIETTTMREPITERAYLGECQATCVLLEATPDLLAACQLALALVKETWIEDHGSESVGRVWGALDEAISKATNRA